MSLTIPSDLKISQHLAKLWTRL